MKYDYLVQTKKLYLPNFNSHAISDFYLDSVFSSKIYSLKEDSVNSPPEHKKATSQELLQQINSELHKQQLLPLGIDETMPANKEWLWDVLYTLCPTLDLFMEEPKGKIPAMLEQLSKE